jgi:hypothetical protein
MTKYTEAEVRQRVAYLTPPPAVLSRLRSNAPEDLVLGVKDLVARTLNSDIDGFYHLVGIAVRAERVRIAKAVAAIGVISRMSLGAQRATPAAKNYLPQILDTLSALETAPVGERDRLVAKLAQLARTYAASCRSSQGAVSVGVPSATAATMATAAVLELEAHLDKLFTGARQLRAAQYRYEASDFWRTSPGRHASYARRRLEDHSKADAIDPSAAVLDALVASTLVAKNTTVNSLKQAKYSGTVTLGVGLPPKESGFFLPRALPEATYGAALVKSVTVDGATAGTVTYPASTSPRLVLPVPDGMFVRHDAGSTHQGDGVTATYPQYLKTAVIPLSVEIRTQSTTGAVMLVSDDGLGGWVGDAVGGSIDYLTGIATVTFSANVRAYDAIHWEYDFSVVGDMKVRNAVGVFVSNFNTMNVFRHNTLETATLSQAAVLSSTALLAAELAAQFAGAPLTVTASGDDVHITSDIGGAYAQLMLPAYAVTAEVNPAFGAPTWTTSGGIVPPATLNAAIYAVNAVVPRAFGRDTTTSDVVVSAPIADLVHLSTQEQVLLPQTSFAITTANKANVVVADAGDLAPGDFLEFSSPVPARIAIASLVPLVGTTVIILEDEYPFPVTTGTTLAATVDTVFTGKSATTDLISYSTTADATLAVTVGTLWPAGTYRAYAEGATLPSDPVGAYPIRPGDVVLQGENAVATVTASAGALLKLALTSGYAFYPDVIGTDLVYPYGALSIYGLGQVRFTDLQKTLLSHVAALDGVRTGLSTPLNVYINSGAGQSDAIRALADVASVLAAYDTLLAGYAANRVDAVDVLLSSLAGERMSGVVDLLTSLQFDLLDFETPEEMSTQVDLATELQTAADAYSPREEVFTHQAGADLLDDYTKRGSDPLRPRS